MPHVKNLAERKGSFGCISLLRRTKKGLTSHQLIPNILAFPTTVGSQSNQKRHITQNVTIEEFSFHMPSYSVGKEQTPYRQHHLKLLIEKATPESDNKKSPGKKNNYDDRK